MTQRVLIIGGRGRIGSSIAQDLITHTDAEITVTGRDKTPGKSVDETLGDRVQFRAVHLDDRAGLSQAIADSDLVIHSAGPFHHRDARVLQLCIDRGVNYTDVSDSRGFTRRALALQDAAEKAGITAIINTGIFPGISNSMVRQGVEQLQEADRIHLSYVVGGSGGAGVTVMRTTFLGLQNPFDAWIDGRWQPVKPYTDRETIEFPPPYGKVGVYWFDMPEAFTLPDSFPVKTAITKFGTSPDLYNHLTWMVANLWPSAALKNSAVVEFLSQVSYRMTGFTDKFSGTGVAVRSEVNGRNSAGEPATVCSAVVHPSAAVATGIGTGTIAELMLKGKLTKPGVWPVEQALSTPLFESIMTTRGIEIAHHWL
ncbi:saccharopine dehydrogenase NADP-binding domain-containing protein [Laspinema sp. A4]|uniref:saccharopine dehydrogenase family protein n=1 Tax=Laspinema sp. D2d TaxID=2953686 RepID=UPI0021BB9108|nr:saccharopine dehydrogenase NADP-binding domain-containing protein [Laspinema sp. D2d]MCT7982502.1 saccharopine dehydrogenase NADP-binding domain-containing protein [Laspinema sp. D2d]